MPAVIDVGSHTIRLLIGEMVGGRLSVRHYEHRVTHLGAGISRTGRLSESAVAKTLEALEAFAAVLAAAREDRVRIVGTEALRVAHNRDALIQPFFQRTGWTLEVIDGVTEALYMATGVLHALEPSPQRALIFDVGGASTEVVCVDAFNLLFNRSYSIGVVTLRDHPSASTLLTDFSTQLHHDLCRAGLDPALRLRDWDVIGTAGTVTTLAAAQQKMVHYCPDKITNFRLNRSQLHDLARTLEPLTTEQRENMPGIESGRGDTIVAGIQLVQRVLDVLQRSSMVVCDAGLLQGVFYASFTARPVLCAAD